MPTGAMSETTSTTTQEDQIAPVDASSSRRGLLRLAGAAAAGVVGATVIASRPAAATNGLTTTDSSTTTVLNYLGNQANHAGFLFQAGTVYDGTNSLFPSALAGWTTTSSQKAGIYGYSSVDGGYGIVGRADGQAGIGVFGKSANASGVRGDGKVGVFGSGSDVGVSGLTTSGNAGVGVFGDAGTGIKGHGTGIGVHGISEDGLAMKAEGVTTGLEASASNGNAINAIATRGDGINALSLSSIQGSAAVRGTGGEYALATGRSDKACLYLQPNKDFDGGQEPKTVPTTRTDEHLVGEMESVDGDLWFCVAAGTPGTWRKITGPGVAGGFHPLTPGRVYDSRQASPANGAISAGQNRTISVADRRDALLSTGAVVQANFVPAGATAVAANVTITQTAGSGYLVFNPGGNTTVGASTINWKSDNQDIANGVILTLDASRQLTIVAGGGGSTDFIVDITGYYL